MGNCKCDFYDCNCECYEQGKKEFKQNLSKWIENYSQNKGEWYKYYIKVKDLKELIKNDLDRI